MEPVFHDLVCRLSYTLVIVLEMLERMGLIIAAKRAELCIGQKELADRAGIHRTYISDIERGRRNVTVGTLNKIAEVLGLTVGGLLTAAEKPPADRTEETSAEVNSNSAQTTGHEGFGLQ